MKASSASVAATLSISDYSPMKGSRKKAASRRGGSNPDLAWARLFRAARDAKGWSQADLVRVSGVDKQSIYRVEQGRNHPRGGKALALIAALDIPQDVMASAFALDEEATDAYITALAARSLGDGSG